MRRRSGAVVEWCGGGVVRWWSGAVVEWCGGGLLRGWGGGAAGRWATGRWAEYVER